MKQMASYLVNSASRIPSGISHWDWMNSIGGVMKCTGLSGKWIALLVSVGEREVVLQGRVELRRDVHQGLMLQVTIVGDEDATMGRPVFWISEQRWQHGLARGVDYGCDYLLDLSQPSPSGVDAGGRASHSLPQTRYNGMPSAQYPH